MASVNSVSSSSSSSSIYGNRNVITGLASGMDTESMLENIVSGYQTKIQSLQAQQTKLSWKQDAYRSITDQLIELSRKYTSYTSTTNLASNAFFSGKISSVANGDFAGALSVSGTSKSDIQINSVAQLATAARYSVSASHLKGGDMSASEGVDWGDTNKVSSVSGSLDITYAGKTLSLSFASNETYENTEAFVSALNDKISAALSDAGSSAVLTAKYDAGSGKISFVEGANSGGSNAYISGASGSLNNVFDITAKSSYDSSATTFSVKSAYRDRPLYEEQDMATYLNGKTLDVTLDGVTRHITISGLEAGASDNNERLIKSINEGLKTAFGSKITANMDNGKLSFDLKSQGSVLSISSSAGEALGIGKSGVSNYMDTGRTMGELMETERVSGSDGKSYTTIKGLNAAGAVGVNDDSDVVNRDGVSYDTEGNRIAKINDQWVQVDEKNNVLYDVKVNDVTVGKYSANSALDAVMNAINNNKDAGVNVSFSRITGKFTFTANETGADSRIEIGGSLGQALFGVNNGAHTNTYGTYVDGNNRYISGSDDTYGTYYVKEASDGKFYMVNPDGSGFIRDATSGDKVEVTDQGVLSQIRGGTYTAGTDAVMNITVNGDNLTLTRSSNTVDIDGMTVTAKDTFNAGVVNIENGSATVNSAALSSLSSSQKVTFSSSTDADSIVSTIKEFVDAYNKVMSDTRSAYSTQPLKKSSSKNTGYEPLSDSDKEDMSESAIKAYEDKAKTGILFGDTDLSSLYSQLRSAIEPSGDVRKAMEAIGLTTTYSNGVTSLSLDETKLRAALNSNPDTVRNVFVGSDGLMSRMTKVTDAYASTSIANPGILVRKAGTTKSSLSLMDNNVQDQVDNVEKQIESWQSKLSDKIDYYTKQFTLLEQLMSQMNSQSSMLADMMGY